MDSVDLDSAGFCFLIGSLRSGFGDHVDLDAFRLKLLGEFINVGADPSHNPRWVFPRQHHDAHSFIVAGLRKLRLCFRTSELGKLFLAHSRGAA